MGKVVMVSVLVSTLTSAGVLFGLRMAEQQGFLAPKDASVPSVVNMKVDQARELLSARGFLLSLGSERSDATRACGCHP